MPHHAGKHVGGQAHEQVGFIGLVSLAFLFFRASGRETGSRDGKMGSGLSREAVVRCTMAKGRLTAWKERELLIVVDLLGLRC